VRINEKLKETVVTYVSVVTGSWALILIPAWIGSEIQEYQHPFLRGPAAPQKSLEDQPKTSLSRKSYLPWELLIGAASGGVAGFMGFPFEGIKKKRQTDGLKDPTAFIKLLFSPRELMRGSVAFSTSVGLASMVQISLYAAFGGNNKQGAEKARVEAALLAGACGALSSTFTEGVILTQQKLGVGPIDAIKDVLTDHGRGVSFRNIPHLWTGFTGITCREIGWGGALLYGTDWVSTKAEEMVAEKLGQDHPYLALTKPVVSVAFTMLIAVLTQPFDTVASRMQLNRHLMIQSGEAGKIEFWGTAKKLWMDGYLERGALGVSQAFLKGILPRTMMLPVVALSMQYFRKEVGYELYKDRPLECPRFPLPFSVQGNLQVSASKTPESESSKP